MEPGPPLILVVPGRFEQFQQWALATRRDQIKSVSWAHGSFVTQNGTRYQCATTFERTRGYDRGTPVIKVGSWWNHDWVYHLSERFTTITEEDY